MPISGDTSFASSISGLSVFPIPLGPISANKMYSQGLPSSFSGHLNPSAPCFSPSPSLQTVKSCNSTGLAEHTRITMKTRVAIRDKNPHRFQVVPLRDVAAQVSLPQPMPLNRLTVPSTPTGYLACSPPRTVSSYSHPKSVHSSSSTQLLLVDSSSEGNWTRSNPITKVEMESSGYSLSPFLLSSLNLNKKVLAEIDLNQPRLPPTNRTSGISVLLETTRGDYSSTNSSMVSSMKPKGRQHAISQSLHVKSRHDTRRLKFNSLTHIPDINKVTDPEILFHKTEPVGDGMKVTGRVQTLSKAKFLSSTLGDRPKSKKRWSKKRHAMYTPSLLMPYFQGVALSQESFLSGDMGICRVKEAPAVCDFTPLEEDITIRQEIQDYIFRLDDQDSPRRIVHDPFELLPSGSMDFLPIDSPPHHSSPKAMATALSPNLTFSGDEALSVIQSKNSVDSQLTEIAYPEIILDLLVQIDKAIETWSM